MSKMEGLEGCSVGHICEVDFLLILEEILDHEIIVFHEQT